MKYLVMLSVRGAQRYVGQEPDVIELVTPGTLEEIDGGWEIAYEESDLTGMDGVTTVFRVEKEKVTLTRFGKLVSEMIFREGVAHESLYKMEFGALLISVCATKIQWDISSQGCTVDLNYNIEIEQSAAGVVEYHLDIKAQ
jgi:uncharacterized beta-barrel protein YwiB (DUF1934 family)